MNGRYFTYDGESSVDYGLIIAGIEKNDEINLALKREILRGTFNRNRQRLNHMGTSWAEPLSFKISLMKNVCKNNYDDEKLIFTEDEVDEIAMWLTSPDYPTLFHMFDYYFKASPYDSVIALNFGVGSQHTYEFHADGYKTVHYTVTKEGDKWFTVYDAFGVLDPPDLSVALAPDYVSFATQDEDYIRAIKMVIIDGDGGADKHQFEVDKFMAYDVDPPYYTVLNHKYDYFGIFEDLEPQVMDGQIVGLTATFTTNSPFAWSPEQTLISRNNEISVYIKSADRYRELYPVIGFTPAVSEDPGYRTEVSIRNTRDDLGISLKLYQGITTYIDCEKCTIWYTSVNPDEESIYTNVDDIVEQDITTITESGITDERHIYLPRLYQGQNNFVITGDCEVSLTYREPRKVGEY